MTISNLNTVQAVMDKIAECKNWITRLQGIIEDNKDPIPIQEPSSKGGVCAQVLLERERLRQEKVRNSQQLLVHWQEQLTKAQEQLVELRRSSS
ncbi:hypothetical protein BGW41_008157 [Actinomortierella wolfii]|nr:hypothetical protein BGW41_008157 [Actinomortierella wolfii]